jgi:sugar lactone lactonase YvrE
MRLSMRTALVLLMILTLFPFSASAWDRGDVKQFAALPPGEAHPEGITVDLEGNVYVTTFAANKPNGSPGTLFVFKHDGKLLRQVTIVGSSRFLLDLAFHPTTGALLVIDFGNAQVLSVNPVTGAASVFMTVTGSAGLNVLTFDDDGNVYVSDSFQGIIWKTSSAGGAATAWVSSPLLTTSGIPPFGANGLAFNQNRTALFVANTGNDTVVKIPVSGSPLTPGTPEVFVNSVNGADGLIIDEDDNIWVAANQADEIVVIEPTQGRVIAKLGDFEGVDNHGAPNGFLFPASLVFHGNDVFVTNLSLNLVTALGNPAARTVDSAWAEQVTTHTISKIKKRIPKIKGLPD